MRFSIWMILNVVILAYGIYTLVTWYKMKQSGQVNPRLLSRNRLQGRPCRDKQAFYETVLQPTMIMGIVTTIVGALSILTDLLRAGRIATLIADVVFLGVALWYSKKVTDAIRTYYY